MYTPNYTPKLSGLHKGNTVTNGINQKATQTHNKLTMNTLDKTRNAIMLLLPLH